MIITVTIIGSLLIEILLLGGFNAFSDWQDSENTKRERLQNKKIFLIILPTLILVIILFTIGLRYLILTQS